MAYHVLNDELKRLVVQVCNQHMASWQPRPRRGRRQRHTGTPAVSTPQVQYYTAKIDSPISKGTAEFPAPGQATIYVVNESGSTSSLGTKQLLNPYDIVARGSCTCLKITDDMFLIAGTPLEEQTLTFVTSVSCVNNSIVYNTSPIVFVSRDL